MNDKIREMHYSFGSSTNLHCISFNNFTVYKKLSWLLGYCYSSSLTLWTTYNLIHDCINTLKAELFNLTQFGWLINHSRSFEEMSLITEQLNRKILAMLEFVRKQIDQRFRCACVITTQYGYGYWACVFWCARTIFQTSTTYRW